MVPDNAIAKAIATKLPSSYTNLSTGNKVTTSVPVPGALQGYITSAGIVSVQKSSSDYELNRFSDNNSRSFNVPSCDKGFTPHYIVNPLYFTTGFKRQNDKSAMTAVYTGMSDLYEKNGRYYTFAFNNLITEPYMYPFGFLIKRYFNTYDNSSALFDARGQRFAYFMTVCLPNGEWYVSSKTADLVKDMSAAQRSGSLDAQSWD